MRDLVSAIKALLRDVILFTYRASGLKLRRYQVAVAQAIVDSVIHRRGLTFVVVFPRQSGKNELQAQIETYLMTLYSQLPAEIVKASPTWKPQSLNAMRRLERVLKRNLITRDRWRKEAGYLYRLGEARVYFMSAEPSANVVGATASTLLECDEAQDVLQSKWDKDFAPMAASTNATRVFWGTAWTSKTLLARELRAAQKAQDADGRRRVFRLTADDVAKEVPAYGQFVAQQIAALGRNHPLVRTQFFGEEIDAEGGLFGPERRALMQGDHHAEALPLSTRMYALLIDVAGEDEAVRAGSEDLANDARDTTACTVVQIDTTGLDDPALKAPIYHVVNRYGWRGTRHTAIYGQLRELAEHWRARWVVIDATGVGAGLASFLDDALPGRVLPFVFSEKSKSDLGWKFLSIIETGRLKDYRQQPIIDPLPDLAHWQKEFWEQLEFVTYEARSNHILHWSVPNRTRNQATGDLVHDDWVLSAALCAVLDEQPMGTGHSAVVAAIDPLAEMERSF